MDKRKRLTVTFGEYDDDVYSFLQNQKNASALIRYLVRLHMNNEPIVGCSDTEKSKKKEKDEKPFAKSAELDLEKARALAKDFEL